MMPEANCLWRPLFAVETNPTLLAGRVLEMQPIRFEVAAF